MPNAVRVFFKTGGIETGGANALTGLVSGGTMVSESGGATPLDLPELDTVYTGYVKMVDENGDDPGFDTVEHVAFDPPAGLQVCETADGTFVDGPLETSIHARGVFQPFFLKPTARVDDGDAYDLSYGALSGGSIVGMTPTAGTRVGQVGTVTLTRGGTSLVADCADVASADGYQWDIATVSNFATYTRTETTASTQTFSGLTPFTTYYVRCRAYSELGAGAFSATASGTPALFFDSFDRSDSTDLGTAWTEHTAAIVGNPIDAQIASNQLATTCGATSVTRRVSVDANGMADAATDMTAQVKVVHHVTTGSARAILFARSQAVYNDDGDTGNGANFYELMLHESNRAYLRLFVNQAATAPSGGTPAEASAGTVTAATGGGYVTWDSEAGDLLRIVCVGTTIEAWAKHPSGAWTKLMTMTDNQVASGRAGLGFYSGSASQTATYDDFLVF